VYLIEIKIWHLEIPAKEMHADVWFGSKGDISAPEADIEVGFGYD
jgi:hypothetical protein